MKTALSLTVLLMVSASRAVAADPAAATGKPLPAVEIVSKDEAKEVAAVVDAIIAAGFPDTAKATLYAGKLTVSANVDPKDPPPLPTSASNMQATNPQSNKTTYQFQFNGLHAKLPDGSWLISLSHHFKPKNGDSVNSDDATVVKVADLTAAAAAAYPIEPEKVAAKWLAALDPDCRPRAAAAMKTFAPVTVQLHLGSPDLFVPAIVVLHRAGWSDAAIAAFCVADNRARQFWQLRPWTGPPPPFDPTGDYTQFKTEEAAWAKAKGNFKPEAPAVALRRALFRWCRAQLMVESPEDAMLPLDVAAAAAKAMADPGDSQGNAAKIDALLAGAKLPVGVDGRKAGLAVRLQGWEARPRMPRMVVGGGGPQANGTISMTTAFVAPVVAYTPDKKDLDALIALLGDERPSRFFDFNGPRTVGDNAFRAAAVLLDADPRRLAGYSLDKPWTADERKAAAAAVQKWWKVRKKEKK